MLTGKGYLSNVISKHDKLLLDKYYRHQQLLTEILDTDEKEHCAQTPIIGQRCKLMDLQNSQTNARLLANVKNVLDGYKEYQQRFLEDTYFQLKGIINFTDGIVTQKGN